MKVLIQLFLLYTTAFSFYVSDSLGSYSNHWITNFYYSRDGIVLPQANSTVVHAFSGGLKITGRPNTVGISRNGYWKGIASYNTNKFTATINNPFGFQIYRTNALLVQGGTGDARYQTECGLWMFVWKPGVTGSNEWEIMDDFLEFYDFSGDWGTAPNHSIDMGSFDGVARSFSFTNAVRPDGSLANLTNQVIWDYLSGGTRNNTNKIGFRMTHDGTYIRFYVNPDPLDLYPAYPNEWCYVGNRQVTWSSSIQVMLGTAVKRGDTASMVANVDYTNFLVRSAVDGFTGILRPGEVDGFSREVWLTFELTNRISPDNAGLNYLKIAKGGSARWDLRPENVEVSRFADNASEVKLKSLAYRSGAFPKKNETAILNNFGSRECRILLGEQIVSSTALPHLRIRLKVNTPALGESERFEVYGLAEQFDAMPQSAKNRYSTADWQRAEGDFTLRVATPRRLAGSEVRSP